MTSNEILEAGVAYLQGTFKHMGWAVTVTPGEAQADAHVLTLTGEIDPLRQQPHVVSALSLLTSQAMSRAGDRLARCVLDVGGNLAAREALLETLARDVAGAVARTGKVAVIEGLSSSDRRAVHTALRDNPRVDTQGEGPSEGRRLAVGPARQRD